jgi:hypothetical protein
LETLIHEQRARQSHRFDSQLEAWRVGLGLHCANHNPNRARARRQDSIVERSLSSAAGTNSTWRDPQCHIPRVGIVDEP